MVSKLDELVQDYNPKTIEEEKNSIKEVMQEVVLFGLYKAGFFEKAAFYGGTALRIFYGLDRFSEDLDFSLIEPDNSFDFNDYLPTLRKIIENYGLKFDVEVKEKTKESDIKSAFLKGNTIEHLLLFYPNKTFNGINHNDKIKIKFEVDTTPPAKATFETKYQITPEPYKVKLYDKESLFSGKLHALICRTWKSRVKGRDLYDYIFYLQKGIKFNLEHLHERLIVSGYISREEEFSLDIVKKILINRFNEIDYDQAKEDVISFIKDKSSLDIWCYDFFKSITEKIDCI